MYSLKAKIFSEYFPGFFTVDDYNKDVNGKGFLQRFIETLAEDWDETVISTLSGLVDSMLVPATLKDKFVPYLEKQLGLEPISDDMAIRRRLLSRILEVYRCKGTRRSYQLVFSALGFEDAEIIGVGLEFGFDSPLKFDNNIRRFDMGKCYKCRYYRLNLVGGPGIDGAMYNTILKAIRLVEPIYCNLYALTIDNVDADLLSIFIDDDGDLVYTTLSTSTVGFTLSANGDLRVYGTDAQYYFLNDNGDLIFNKNG